MKHLLWVLILVVLGGICAVPSVQAESQVYNPRYQTMSNYTYQRNLALQKRIEAELELQGAEERFDYEQYRQRQVLAVENNYRARFPVHPGLYRDAYDRGSFGPSKK